MIRRLVCGRLCRALARRGKGTRRRFCRNGRVVVVGGAFKVRALSSVEIYDPSSDSWTDAVSDE